MGFLETILSGLNFIDLAIAVGVCGFTAYSIWHTQQASPPWVWGPILGVGATFAASTLLNWFTLSCHLASCAWLLTLTIVVDLLVSTGAAIFGLLFLTQFATVAGWLRDLEADAGSQAGYPLPLDLYSHLSAWRDWIAAVLFALAALQLLRAIACCIVKERLQRARLPPPVDYEGAKYDFNEPDLSSSNYRHWDLNSDRPSQQSVLDRVHERLEEERRIAAALAQREAAAAPKKKAPIVFKKNSRRGDLGSPLSSSGHAQRSREQQWETDLSPSEAPPWRRT